VDVLQAKADAADTRLTWLERLSVKFFGTLDLGFFSVEGDGSGVRPDYGGQIAWARPLLRSWVLVGDPLSTTINSRGDVADTGASRAIQYNPIHALGHPGFLLNAFSLGLRASYDDAWVLNVLVDFLPRDRDVSRPGAGLGDFFDLKLAYLRYQLDTRGVTWLFFAGKIDSLLGVEYRAQEAADRLTVTPSLICRYTCGRPVGLKVHARLLEEALELSLALTNGSSQVEFFPFSNELDFNLGKTLSGRVLVRLPVADGLELSVSGSFGTQDRQRDDTVLQGHVGGAAVFSWGDLRVTGEFVTGRANGVPGLTGTQCGFGELPAVVVASETPCLEYRGAYGLVSYRFLGKVRPYLRVDWRQARMRKAQDYAYDSNGLRITPGVRVDLGPNLVLKAEYSFNRELPPFTDFHDDVFTSSLLVVF
jgi:hypothetical protein